jgi:hypothetical protein
MLGLRHGLVLDDATLGGLIAKLIRLACNIATRINPRSCDQPRDPNEGFPMRAWIRRIIVSLGIGGASYLIMLAFMILSVVYDKELEPVTTFAFETGRRVVDVLDSCALPLPKSVPRQ